SMLQAFVEAGELPACSSLRRVMSSGEALNVELHHQFLSQSSASLNNLYGPTEAAIDVSHWRCVPEPDASSVALGRPIAQTSLRVLDSRVNALPVGVAGELNIGGIALAQGYRGRPAL